MKEVLHDVEKFVLLQYWDFMFNKKVFLSG